MGEKSAGTGTFTIPTAPAAGTSCTSGAANVFSTNYVQLIASTAAALYITGIYVEEAAVSAATYIVVQLATGAGGAETVIGQFLVAPQTGSTVTRCYRPIFPPIPVAISTRIACKTADSVGSAAKLITLECIAQSNVVNDGIPITTVTTVTNQLTAAAIATGIWQDTTAGDFTAANSIGKSVMNGVALGTGLTINAYTGNTAQTGDSFLVVKSGGTGDNAAIKAKTDNLPASPASTTNITAGTITTVTTLTNLPAITSNWLTAAGINASALNGKGDWNIGKTGYALSTAGVQALWDALTSALTTVGSVGKLIVDNLNATISSRMATYTQPTGFLAATFPTTVASTTNITAATGITVATNSDKTGYTLVAGYDPAKTAAQAGDAMTLTAGERTSIGTAVWASATRTLSSFGTLIADIWASATRTLSAFGFTVDTNANATETAIKGKTDSLTFTKAGEIDSNIQSVNDTTVTGNGSPGTEWGP